MRVRAGLMTLALLLPGIASADRPRASVSASRGGVDPAKCRHTTSHLADLRGRDDSGLLHRKLNELPPATAYMAVHRHIGGCEAPLTLVDYRSGSRR